MAELKIFDTVTPANDGAWFAVPDPITGDATDFELLLLGARSNKFQNRIRAIARDREKAIRQGRAYADSDTDIETLVEITEDWRGLTENGEPVPFSKDTLRDLYKRSPDTRSAIFAFIENAKNFTKG